MKWQDDLIAHRRNKALSTLADAELLFEKGSIFSAVNRIYYAMFYEISALLQTKNLSSTKHTGIRALFNEQFIKTGIIRTEIGKFYSVIFDFRQKGDYADFVEFDRSKVEKWLKTAQKFILELDKYFQHPK